MSHEEATFDPGEVREAVRRRYASAAHAALDALDALDAPMASDATSCCGASAGPSAGPSDPGARGPAGQAVFGAALYHQAGEDGVTDAVSASLGCGVPTAVATKAKPMWGEMRRSDASRSAACSRGGRSNQSSADGTAERRWSTSGRCRRLVVPPSFPSLPISNSAASR